MKESYIKKLYSEGFGTIKEKEELKSSVSAGLDFSSELPDAMPDFLIIDALYKEASKWENRSVVNRGADSFNEAAGNFIENFYGAPKPDLSDEICSSGDISATLNLLALAFINGGDASLIPKPSVSSLGTMTKRLGGNVIWIPLSQKNKYYPKYEDIPQKNLKKAKLLYINYPGNPTGQTATVDFFKETIEFARLNELIVLHDASFSALVYDEGARVSMLSVPGAKKVGAELHSLDYGFNMAGWGVGFIAGNKNIIRAYRDVSSKAGFGLYAPIIRAAAYALTRMEIPFVTAKKYERRCELLARELVRLGFKAKKPKAGFYIYVKVPKGTACGNKFESARSFEKFLGAKGIRARSFEDGYIRFSAAFPALGEDEERSVAASLYEKLRGFDFIF